jgi:lysophospholipase L1-like esterase
MRIRNGYMWLIGLAGGAVAGAVAVLAVVWRIHILRHVRRARVPEPAVRVLRVPPSALPTQPARRSTLRRVGWRQIAALVVFGGLLGLAVALLGLRITDPYGEWTDSIRAAVQPCQPASPEFWFYLAVKIIQEVRPCAVYDHGDIGEFKQRVRLNNYGFHDDDWVFAKPPDVFRILILGDSFAQGIEVPMRAGYPFLLEQRLGGRVEVINLGVAATGTDQQLLLYAAFGWRFQPDLVLLQVYAGNDVFDNSATLDYLRFGFVPPVPSFTLQNDRLALQGMPVKVSENFFPDSAPYLWLSHMQVAQSPTQNVVALPPPSDAVLAQTWPPIVQTDPFMTSAPVELGMYFADDATWQTAWATTDALFAQTATLVAQTATPPPRFAAFVIPDRRAVYPSLWRRTVLEYPFLVSADVQSPNNRLAAMLRAQNIITLDSTPILQQAAAQPDVPMLYFADDGHFTSAGHAVLTEALAKWLLDERLTN